MRVLSRFRGFWRNLVHHGRVERELDEELRSTFDMLAEEHVRTGQTPAEGRRRATLQLGGAESIKDRVRDVRAGALWAALVQDVRYALRLLRRSPVFTAFAVASLALGIGATATIFSLFDGIVLRKLPVPEPDRLVVASFGTAAGRFNYSMPYPHFEAIRTRSATLDGLFAMYPIGRVTVAAGGDAEITQGMYVTGDYYRTLQLTPAAGRLLAPFDDAPGQAVAVLNHAYWQRRFGGSANVIGTTIPLNGLPFTIVGVEPPGFSGTEVGRPYDISVPMRALDVLSEGAPLWNEAFATWIYMMGRLKPGVSLAEAEGEAKTIFAQVSTNAARSATEQRLARDHHLRLESGSRGSQSDLRFTYERWLWLLLMLLGAVLLLASLNVATLLLSRSDARHREIATRLALGAGRSRIIRQFLTESIVLAACACGLGLGLASWGAPLLLRVAVPSAERVTVDVSPDLRLVLFTIAISCLTCVLFGLIPAIRATSSRRLMGARQIGSGRQRRALDRALVASQVALSLVLLVAAALCLRTLDRLWAQEPGYTRENVLMFSIDAHLAGMKGPEVPNTYRRVLDELRSVAGTQSVTMSSVRPVSDGYYFVSSFFQIGGKTLSNDQRVRVAYNNIAPGYFATLGIPVIAGRDFDDRDSLAAPKVVIISERLARHFEGNPVGQRLGANEVVAIAKDMRYASVKDAPREVVYFPIFQSQPKDIWYAPTFEIRYTGNANNLARSLAEAVARVDPALKMFQVRTLEEQTQDSLSRERLLAMLTTYFGGFAVLLACIGLYGLMSYGVTQRTAEIGLRMALGAQPRTVRRLIVRDAAITVIAGALIGLAAARAVARVVESQLFGVQPTDPTAIAGATGVLLTMAFVAAYLPARRASRINPLTALRHE